MSPRTTSIASAPGLSASRASISADAPTRGHGESRSASGRAMRPVPIPSSSTFDAGPASSTSRSTQAACR
jgi:hypothetical protein